MLEDYICGKRVAYVIDDTISTKPNPVCNFELNQKLNHNLVNSGLQKIMTIIANDRELFFVSAYCTQYLIECCWLALISLTSFRQDHVHDMHHATRWD